MLPPAIKNFTLGICWLIVLFLIISLIIAITFSTQKKEAASDWWIAFGVLIFPGIFSCGYIVDEAE